MRARHENTKGQEATVPAGASISALFTVQFGLFLIGLDKELLMPTGVWSDGTTDSM